MNFNPKFTGTDNELESLLDIDISEWVEVIKYEAPQPANMHSNAKGSFPYFIPKTDQERIQNLWKEYKNKYNEEKFEVTLKLDGTSATYYINEGKLGVCSRNLELKLDEDSFLTDKPTEKRTKDTYISVGYRHGIFNFLQNCGRNLAIQGEIIGEGIQQNKEKISGQFFFIYDVYDIDQRKYLTSGERYSLLPCPDGIGSSKLSDLATSMVHIPILEFKELSEFNSLDEILQYAEGKSLNSEIREGLVFKSTNLINGRVVTFKAISNKFLLKYE
jgi:RNA ligase (TIGR02306 family)